MNNEENEEQQPFSDVLDALFTTEPLPIHLLYRLSDMTAAEHEELRQRWTAVAVEKRRLIVRHLADLTEDNFAVDYVPLFRDCFADPDAVVRVAALDGLWDATDTRLISPVTQMMQSDEAEIVRTAAVSALSHFLVLAQWGQIPRRYTEPITQALLAVYDDRDTAVATKRAALEALGAADHARITGLISNAYESSDEGMRISAVFAMGNSADKSWLAIVLAEMENMNPEMRVEAARAAGLLGSSDALSSLEKLLEDDDYEVQIAAIIALGQIGGDNVQEILLRLAQEVEDENMLVVIEEALEEMALFSGEFQLLDVDDDDDEDDDEDDLLLI